MKDLIQISWYMVGVLAGGLLAIQSVLNTTLAKITGTLGSIIVLTTVGLLVALALALSFPGTVTLRNLPPLSQWYLYLGAALGILILATPILLVPKIGTTSTLVAIVFGQLCAAVAIDHFGWLASPRIELNLVKVFGITLVAIGTLLICK